MRRSFLSRQCPLPWTEEDEQRFRRNCEELLAEVEAAGGFERYVESVGVSRVCAIQLWGYPALERPSRTRRAAR